MTRPATSLWSPRTHDFNFGAFGPGGVHAPSATPDGQGGVIVIFNMNPAKPTAGWNQIMTLPRRLTLIGRDGRDALGVEPAGDVESLRGAHQHVGPDDAAGQPGGRPRQGSQGNAIEIVAEIDTNDAPMVELNVLRSPDRQEYTRIAFYRERGYRDWERYTGWERDKLRRATYSLITIDSSYSSLQPDVLSRAPETGPVFLEPEEPLQLRVFVDRSVVEVFVQRQAVRRHARVPGPRGQRRRVPARPGAGCELRSLDAWQMRSIYQV